MSYVADIARSVIRYESADKAALTAFQAEHFGPTARQCDDRYFKWLFEKNPYQDAAAPTLWLCKRDGVIVGQQASIPVMLKAGDLQFKAAWGVDLMVHSQWRMRGVAPALAAAFEASTDVLLGAGMAEAAYKAFMRRGWADLGMLPVFVRPLDPDICARTAHAPQLLAKLTPGGLTRGSAWAAGRLIGGLANAVLEPTAAFDERSNALWTTASRDHPVLVRRDFPYLRWRFDEIPTHQDYQRYYLMRANEVIGYAVIRLEPWRGSTIGRIVDYLAPRRWLRALFALAISELNSKRVAAVFVEQLHWGAESVLRSLGCFRALVGTRFITNARGSASPLRGRLSQREGWCVNRGDSDLDYEPSYPAAQA
jgi:hypothetical protein